MSGCATPVRRIARSRRAIRLAFLLVLVAAPIAAQNAPRRATLALVGGTLIDGTLQFLSTLRSGGDNDLKSGNYENASKILGSAIDEVAVIRGRLGAFERNTLQTNVRSLQSAIENLTSSESRIRDTDFADETSKLTRAQILTSASTSVLSLANQQAQQVLQLLG